MINRIDLSSRISASNDSPFTSMAAVDAWDAWFRWRDEGVLRDITVESTWQRVASTLTATEPPAVATGIKRRLTDEMMSWRLLLDERILASAGTGMPAWSAGALVAVLNLAAFVLEPLTSHATLDVLAVEQTAALAVRVLDNAMSLLGDDNGVSRGFRIGVVGLADALALCGVTFGSNDACRQATLASMALARGCVSSSALLARERGAALPCTREWIGRAQALGLETDVFNMASAGLRHAALTAITSQPRLALLANEVTDAIDPGDTDVRPQWHATPDADHQTWPGGRPASPSRDETEQAQPALNASVHAQLRLRGAMQPWIDAPITCPLSVSTEPSDRDSAQWAMLASELGLPQPSWRLSETGFAS